MHQWFAVAAAGLLLAACSPTGQQALQANVAGGETAGAPVAGIGVFGTSAQSTQPAAIDQAAIDQIIASTFTPPKRTPLPPARPDLGDRTDIAAVGPGTLPLTVAAYVAAPAPDGTPSSAQARSIAAYERAEAGVGNDPAETATVAAAAAPTGVGSNGAAFGKGDGQRWNAAYPNVETDCFPADLRKALDTIADHFGAPVEVTSGYRDRGRRHSLHRSCMAADIRVAGVSPGTVARYARTVPGINGVGTYHWVAVTHIDIRAQHFAWRY